MIEIFDTTRPTLQRISESLLVDVSRGTAVWKAPSKFHRSLTGCDAGGPRRSHNGKFYWVIRLDGRTLKRGHLVFFIANGKWPEPVLDHRNGDSLDDRLDNLREATITQNAWNHQKRAKREPLPMGVRRTKLGRYQARLGFNKRSISIGIFATAESAADAYRAKRKEMYGEFA